MRKKQVNDEYFISLGGGTQQLPLIQSAKKLGFKLIVIDINKNAPGFSLADLIIIESIYEYRKIYKKITESPLFFNITGIGVRSFGKAVYTAAYLSDKLGLIGNRPQIVKIFQNKLFLKSKLSSQGVLVPKEINKDSVLKSETTDITFPCILKPSVSHGKNGIMEIGSARELKKALKSISMKQMILENKISGNEITVCGFVKNSIFNLVAISDKYTETSAPFREISHYLPSRFLYLSGEIIINCQNIVNFTELDNGPVVAEFIVTSQDNLYLIEFNPEVGGEFLADTLIPEYFGFDYFESLVKLLTKQTTNFHFSKINDNLISNITFYTLPQNKNKVQQCGFIDKDNKIKIHFQKNLLPLNTDLGKYSGNASRIFAIASSSSAFKTHQDYQNYMEENFYLN